jgi:RNA polymerase sigma-70 factor (ECF subfamily)
LTGSSLAPITIRPSDQDRITKRSATATRRRLLGLLVLVTGDAAEAEDIVREAFVRASARWRQLREHPAPEAWVRRVALNLVTDRGRRSRRRMAALIRHGPPGPLAP